MDATDYIPSRWLKAEDLDGKDVNVVISDVTEETIDETKRLVVQFESLGKGLVLNKTNVRRLIEAFGNDTDNWIGKRVPIGTAEVSFKGEDVLGIRIKTL